jgi:hypothetical protein
MTIGIPRAVRMAFVFGVVALVYLAIALWHPLGASAATITVTTTIDNFTPGDRSISLREAIASINAGNDLGDPDITAQNPGTYASNDTITFASAVFPFDTPETIFVAASPFELTFTGGPTTIDGTGHKVILDGSGLMSIFVVDPSVEATLIALTMQNGASPEGGAILNFGTLTVANSTLDGNSGFFEGGAIDNLNALTVTNSTFTNNTASIGGAIATSTGPMTVTGSTFVGNTAAQPARTLAPRQSSPIRPTDGFTNAGGAIFICSCASAEIANSTFSRNAATSVGGAILDEGNLTLTNVTISGNSANNGGGVLVDGGSGGTLIARNALIAGNILSGSGGTSPDVNGPVDSASANNLIGVGDGSTGLTNSANGNLVGTGAAPIASLLGALGNYSGSTQTIPLLPGSPAIDAGTNGTSIPATDQRGKPRVGAPDIGAFESQGFALAVKGPTNLKIGEIGQYTATVTVPTGSVQSLTGVVWKSSDETVATVSADGKMKALRSGPVTLTATANGLQGSLLIQVAVPILTGAQPGPAPASRPGGTASNPAANVPIPAPAPPSR